MTQQPALERGQVWVPKYGFARVVLRLFSERVVYRDLVDRSAGSEMPVIDHSTSWTAWRDWQQRHDARLMEGGRDDPAG